MKKLKEILFYFVIFICFLNMFLFIKQTINYNKVLNEKLTFEMSEEYENIYNESIDKLSELMIKTKDNESDQICLNTVIDSLSYTYKRNNLGNISAKDFVKYYFDFDNSVETHPPIYNNVVTVINNCNIKKDNLSEENKTIYENLLLSSSKNLVLFEDDFYWSKINELNYLSMDYKNISAIIKPSFESIRKIANMTLEKQIQSNDIDYIENLMLLVGDKYE